MVKIKPVYRQLWVSSGVLISVFAKGMVMGYTACMLQALQAPDSPIEIDLNSATWLASVPGMSNMVGCVISSFLMDKYGRKKAYFLGVIPGLTGWFFMYYGNDFPTLLFGRILAGVTGGAIAALGAIVLGEYNSPKLRGVLLNLKTTALSSGALVVHILGYFFDWKTVALISMVPDIIAILITATWCESPAWMISRNEFEKSESNFYLLRGKTRETVKEIEAMIQAQKERGTGTKLKSTIQNNIINFFKKFTQKDFVKPCIITVFGAILLETCGAHVYPMYAVDFMKELTTDSTQAFFYVIAVDIIVTISSTIASVLIKIFSRRSLLLTTGSAACFVLFVVSLYLFLVAKNIISNTYPLVPIILLGVYFVLANFGGTIIPYVLLGEIFPLAHKGVASFFAGSIFSLCFLISTKTTLYLIRSVHAYGTFGIFGLCIIVSLTVLYFLQPETKDKTLQQIEDYFNYGRYDVERVKDDDIRKRMIDEA